ncbi:MAG TPA: serine hydrolase domain-containing protein, partial [Micromonospora sp.]
NPGYAALGELVARLRGEPWHEALRREVLEPLGMRRTGPLPQAPYARGWAVHPWADVLLPEPAQDTGVMGPAGQLWSTVADLGRFATLLADGGGVLRADSVEEMRAPAAPPEEVGDVGYGLGLQLRRVDGVTLAGHTGSMPGYLAACWVDVSRGLASVVLCNATSGIPVGALGADLLGIVAAHEPTIPAQWRPARAVDPALLALTGPWYWGPEPYLLRLDPDGSPVLEPLSGGGRRCRFRAADDGWVGLEGYYAGVRLRVVRDASGGVTHLDVGSFVFTREPYGQPGVQPGGVDPAGWSTAG